MKIPSHFSLLKTRINRWTHWKISCPRNFDAVSSTSPSPLVLVKRSVTFAPSWIAHCPLSAVISILTHFYLNTRHASWMRALVVAVTHHLAWEVADAHLFGAVLHHVWLVSLLLHLLGLVVVLFCGASWSSETRET